MTINTVNLDEHEQHFDALLDVHGEAIRRYSAAVMRGAPRSECLALAQTLFSDTLKPLLDMMPLDLALEVVEELRERHREMVRSE